MTITFNKLWVDEVHINDCAIIERAAELDKNLSPAWRVLESIFLLKSITFIDLTTLGGDDTISNVTILVNKAIHPLNANFLQTVLVSIVDLLETIYTVDTQFINVEEFLLKSQTKIDLLHISVTIEDIIEVKSLLKRLGFTQDNVRPHLLKFLSVKRNLTVRGFEDKSKMVRVGAVCVYPKFAEIVKRTLEAKGLNCEDTETGINDCSLPIATVAAGFPSGQYGIDSKCKEIEFAVSSGATEIDIVISRCLVLGHRWETLYDEIVTLKQACKHAKLKTILAVGECGSLENVYKASMVAMMAGSDYIKTSTGKETVNATLPTGIIMCRAIRNFYIKTGRKIGFKPAGGIKTADDTLKWMNLLITELGSEWLSYFRIGASSLLNNIEMRLKKLNA